MICFRPLGDDYVYVYLHNDDTADTATPPVTTVPLRKKDMRPQAAGSGIVIFPQFQTHGHSEKILGQNQMK